MGNLMLAAKDAGLGVDSCWIHRAKEEFESEEGKAILKSLWALREIMKASVICVIGYMAAAMSRRQHHARTIMYIM